MLEGASHDEEKRRAPFAFFSFCVKEIFNFDDLAGYLWRFVILLYFILFFQFRSVPGWIP